MRSEHPRTTSHTPLAASSQGHIGDMNTPGQTAAQRVMHTSDAFFHKFITVWLVYACLLTAYTFVWEPDSLYAGVVSIACGLVAKVALQRGHKVLVRWLFITPIFIMLMVAPWLVNGIRTPLLIHMMLLLIFTGWMLGTRVLWIFALSLSANVLAMWYAERQGLWLMPQPLRNIDMWLIGLQFSLILSAVVITVLLRNYRADIQREATWQERLHSTLQFNTLIIDSSPVPIRVFGPDGHCMAVNHAYARLLGNSREHLLSQSLYDSAMRTSGLQKECLEVLQTGQATARELMVSTQDGRTLWLHAHLVPFERGGQRHLLAHFIDITDNQRAKQELEQLAFHDSLTGLPNRRLLWEHFQQARDLCKRNQEWGAILLLDLNRFKQLNDQYGHEAGDQMLQEVAHRMKQTMRATDVIARLGGDEFVLLLQGLGRRQEQAAQHAQVLCDKLQTVLALPYQLGDITYHASASIGISLLEPGTQCTLDDLLREADARMYAHKKSTPHPSVGAISASVEN